MRSAGRTARRWILAAATVSLALRLALVVAWTPHVPRVGDSVEYVRLARHLRTTGAFFPDDPPGIRPPLHIALLAATLGGEDLDPYPWSFVLQSLLDSLTCLLLGALALERFGPRAGAAAAWLYALQPEAALNAACTNLAEPTANLALAGLFFAVHRAFPPAADRPLRVRRAFALGALGGLAALAKGLLVPLAAGLLLGVLTRLRPRRRAALAAAAAALGATLALLPFGLYTRARTGLFLPTGTYGHLALVYDNLPHPRNGLREFLAQGPLPDRIRWAQRIFLERFLADPALVADKVQTRLRILLGPSTILPCTVAALPADRFVPDYRTLLDYHRSAWRLPPGAGRRVQILCTLCMLVLLSLAAGGLWRYRGDPLTRGVLWALLLFGLLVALTVSLDRYRHVLLALLVPYAAAALSENRRDPREPSGARGGAAAAVLAALLLFATMFLAPPP